MLQRSKGLLINGAVLLSTLAVLFAAGEIYVRTMGMRSDKIIALNTCVGFKDKPGTQTVFETPDGPVTVSINSAGYRDVEHAVAKAPDTYRILMLGDSFTEALQVNLEEAFWRKMQKQLEEEGLKVEIMSMGVSSYGTHQALMTYECYGREFKPDMVILNFTNANDPVDNYFRRDAFSPQFELASGTLSLNEAFRTNIAAQQKRRSSLPWGPIYWAKENSKALQYLYDRVQTIQGERQLGSTIVEGTNKIYLKEYTQEWLNAWDLTDALMRRLIANVKSDGARFILVDIPGVEELEPERVTEPEKYDLAQADKHLRTFAEKEDVTYISLFPAISAAHTQKPVHWPYDAHWNPYGHTVAAQTILEELKRLVPQLQQKTP